MQPIRSRLVRRAAVTAGCAGLLLAGVVIPAMRSSAASPASRPPVVAGSTYLALGDSVTFGYREPDTAPPPDYTDPSSFIGYPEDIGSALGLDVTNAACPGETSSSFILTSAQSNGCETSPGGGPGYRSYPLHAAYSGSQLLFAENFLKANPDTTAVSLMIGANDGFLCQETTKDDCHSELPAVVKKLSRNVTTIMQGLRDTAHYNGQIIILNYYSLDYTNALDNGSSEVINNTVDRAASHFGVQIANGYSAFAKASYHSGHNSCTAGLLTQLTGSAAGTCGVHPSYAGQSLLAQTVEEAFIK